MPSIKKVVDQKGNQVVVKLQDGENIQNKTVKRGYLRADEINNFMMIYVVHQLIDGVRSQTHKQVPPMWETWEKSGIITKEQKKHLKMACTYMKKFTYGVFNDNLDLKTKDSIMKKNVKWDIKLMDDYTLQKVYKMMQSMKEVRLTTDEFYDLIEAKHALNCKGCTKDRCECDLQTFFEDHFIPIPTMPNEEAKRNCEYSF